MIVQFFLSPLLNTIFSVSCRNHLILLSLFYLDLFDSNYLLKAKEGSIAIWNEKVVLADESFTIEIAPKIFSNVTKSKLKFALTYYSLNKLKSSSSKQHITV